SPATSAVRAATSAWSTPGLPGVAGSAPGISVCGAGPATFPAWSSDCVAQLRARSSACVSRHLRVLAQLRARCSPCRVPCPRAARPHYAFPLRLAPVAAPAMRTGGFGVGVARAALGAGTPPPTIVLRWIGDNRPAGVTASGRAEVRVASEQVRNLIIVGSGPAGYTAALYAARAQLEPLVFEGSQFGGALMTTTDVENYPGFSDGIMGPDLMQQMRAQAERFGAELRAEDVEELELTGDIKYATVNGERYAAKAIILA